MIIPRQTEAGTKFELNKFANRFERELQFGKSGKIFCLVGPTMSQTSLDETALGFGSERCFLIFSFYQYIGVGGDSVGDSACQGFRRRLQKNRTEV